VKAKSINNSIRWFGHILRTNEDKILIKGSSHENRRKTPKRKARRKKSMTGN
jgi:hypothetical protein